MIITLCGSTKYKKEIEEFSKYIKDHLNCAVYDPELLETDKSKFTDDEWSILMNGLMRAHFNKIDMSDVVIICNFDGYIGISVTEEITYAYARNKPIVFLFRDSDTEEITRDNFATYIAKDHVTFDPEDNERTLTNLEIRKDNYLSLYKNICIAIDRIQK